MYKYFPVIFTFEQQIGLLTRKITYNPLITYLICCIRINPKNFK